MSEYQYYEFQTIDRQLTDRQMRELRTISSRATISRTRFSNYYTYGDLKANPRDLLVRYFDASLSFAHWFYIDIMGLDRGFLAAAVDGASKASATPLARKIDIWIGRLDADERVALLSRVARGDGTVGAELMRRFRQRVPAPAATLPLRTAGALRARAEVLAEQRREVIRVRAAKERMRGEREQAAARDRYLSTLAKRQADAWRRVEALVITKRPRDYDAAIALLRDLREIGERKGRREEFTEHIRALREAHAKKPSFLARLRKAGL